MTGTPHPLDDCKVIQVHKLLSPGACRSAGCRNPFAVRPFGKLRAHHQRILKDFEIVLAPSGVVVAWVSSPVYRYGMRPPGTIPPDWTEILRNVIELETQRGFNNSAVVGGLDRFRERWHPEMASRVPEGTNADLLLKQSYADMGPDWRENWAKTWLTLLGSGGPPAPDEQGAWDSHPQTDPAATDSTLPTPTPSATVDTPDARTLPKSRPAVRLPPAGQSVDDPVERLRGINTRMSERLKRLDVATVRDLLYLFPRRHEDYSNVVSIAEVVPGQECTVVATVWESRVISQGPKGRRQDTEAVLGDENRQHPCHLVRPALRVPHHSSGARGGH